LLERDQWIGFSRDLDWNLSYVSEEDAYPPTLCGSPNMSVKDWAAWDEPFKTTYRDYVLGQHEKDHALTAVKDAIGHIEDYEHLDPVWLNSLKFHGATLPLAEFFAVIGNLRAARFGKNAAWRNSALLGALDELRHTQIPLNLFHDFLKIDAQFDWVHKFYHSNNWVSIASRHMMEELLLFSDPVEMAVGTNFVFETGFTNIQFIGLSALAHEVDDRMFEKMITSIQTDEARHAQIGPAVLEILMQHDPERAQALVDKWFWRSWLLFAVLTGFSMDYLCPVESRTSSFKEFVEEWIQTQFLQSLKRLGLEKPWYWDTFLASIDNFHHMVYASAYSYRATVWFDMVLPGPKEREWLAEKYPDSWQPYDRIWEQLTETWRHADINNDMAVHGTCIVGFCNMCQFVLCGGTPGGNTARTCDIDGQRYIFCSEPCQRIFEKDKTRYAGHKDVVKRVLAGEAPGNLIAILRNYFGLSYATWGKDAFGGDYPWLDRQIKQTKEDKKKMSA
jgi:toluene monooxygenase system protein A